MRHSIKRGSRDCERDEEHAREATCSAFIRFASDCGAVAFMQARFDEIANEMKNMLVKLGPTLPSQSGTPVRHVEV
eukprot:7888087-Lingulodinium_polyedra.AAC.1